MLPSKPSLRSYARSSGWALPVLMRPVICSPCTKGASRWPTSPSTSGPGPVRATGILPLCATLSCMVWQTTLRMNWFPILYLPHLMNSLSLLSGWTSASGPGEGRGDRTPLVVSIQPAGRVPHRFPVLLHLLQITVEGLSPCRWVAPSSH